MEDAKAPRDYVRQNYALETIVNSAIKLQAKYGRGETLAFLLEAGMSKASAERVLGAGPRRSAANTSTDSCAEATVRD